jgi:hypothetical protein
MTKRKNIMINWDVAGNGDAKGRDMISAEGGTGI